MSEFCVTARLMKSEPLPPFGDRETFELHTDHALMAHAVARALDASVEFRDVALTRQTTQAVTFQTLEDPHARK